MKLVKLEVKNFKRLKSVELDLAEVNILVGTNGSGKSSIIQAIHLACCVMRQVERVEKKTSTVGIEELDYVPSNNYKLLGHNQPWGNKAGTPSSDIALYFQRDATSLVASCKLRSARNAGISITGTIPNDLVDLLRKRQNFFSAYIPGISGIPNKEEKKSKKVALKACSYGDSNVILRNVLLLLKELDEQNIPRIEKWISEIAEPMKISVLHDEEKDLSISCNINIDGGSRPIELIGTGYLQLIQIFSYVLLFKPGILLIDEPDTHLHPTVQEKLMKVLARVAEEQNLRVLLTTHSPFIVRGAPTNANVYWIDAGKMESTNRQIVELALGWGAFGKRVIIVSEDSDLSFLRKLISQWPGLDRLVTYFPGTGYKNITTPEQAAEIAKALGGKFKILVHRDRDALTDTEVRILQDRYSSMGVKLWFPDMSDIEAYFCQPAFLAEFLGILEPDATAILNEILAKNATTWREQFNSQREAHNRELYKAGGSPTNDDVWQLFQSRPLQGAKGKSVFRQLKHAITGNKFREELILKHSVTLEIASSLKSVLEQLVK